MKKILAAVGALAVGGMIAVAVPQIASAAPYCGIRWGSTAKNVHAGSSSITNVRAGRHDCFDRRVVDFAGAPGGANVRYVKAVTNQGEGAVIPLRGGAFLQVDLDSPAYDINTGKQTYRFANRRELVNVSGFRTFRQLAYGGSYEGYTTFGLGVRGRLPFRVFTLTKPSRLVIDVAHAW